MRAIVVFPAVCILATAGYAGRPLPSVRNSNRSASEDRKPRCGGHGWALGLLDTSRVYAEGEVDKAAQARSGNPAPDWPATSGYSTTGTVESDARYGATAQVIARFVVDTMECVDSSSFTVVQSSDSAFTMSVRHVLSRLRYEPARKNGRKVRSWVLWKFLFEHKVGAQPPM